MTFCIIDSFAHINLYSPEVPNGDNDNGKTKLDCNITYNENGCREAWWVNL